MKEQADLAPIVEAYKQYKQAKQDVEDSLALLEEENDEEMRRWPRKSCPMPESGLRTWSMNLRFSCFPKTLTMTRTSF